MLPVHRKRELNGMFYFMNGRGNQSRQGDFRCGRTDGGPCSPHPEKPCPPPCLPHPGKPCPPPKPPHPEKPCPHPPGKDGKPCREERHERKDGPEEEKKREHKKECPGHDRGGKNEIACRERNSCCCNRSGCNNGGCPDLLRWALWSSGFFRCNRCEQSGWRHRRGGSGFC